MRIFVAGATGAIGVQLVPMLVEAGHEVAGMTRTPEKAQTLREMGAHPVVCDVYESAALTGAAEAFAPDLIIHELTDLPDAAAQIPEFAERNNRIRTEGTRNLLAAGKAAGAERFLAQSIAWTPPPGGEAVREHERMVLEAGGVVLRYGIFYGPGTYGGDRVPDHPRIHVEEAARRTVELLDAPGGVVVIAEEAQPS